MQITRILAPTAIVYFLMYGLVAPNHQAMAAREVGGHNSHDIPQTVDPSTLQLKASSSNPTEAPKKSLEQLKLELVRLQDEMEKTRGSNDFYRAETENTLKSQIYYKRREIEGVAMGLSSVPVRLLDKSHLPLGSQKDDREKRIMQLADLDQRLRHLEERRRCEKNPKERARLGNCLRATRFKVKSNRVIETIKAGGDPREVEEGCSRQKGRTVGELEMLIEKEKDEERRKKLKKALSNLKYKKRKAERTNKTRKGKDLKGDEVQVGVEDASHKVEKLNYNGEKLGDGLPEAKAASEWADSIRWYCDLQDLYGDESGVD